MARYDKARQKNQERDERVKRVYQANPDMAFQELADMFGLKSRQHAFYIIHSKKKAGVV